MSSEQPDLYRIASVAFGCVSWGIEDLQWYIDNGVLVKVKPCEHGRIEPHFAVSYVQPDAPEMGGSTTQCPGSGGRR